MTYDFIIVGGGSAGRCWPTGSPPRAQPGAAAEAGQDTPHGKIPPEVLDSYPGTAYFDPRFHWTQLKVRTEVVSHNNPHESPPPLRKYEQARILGGGSSINGQLANRGAPGRLRGVGGARRARLGLGGRAALLQEGRARHGLRRAAARQGGAHPRAAHLPGAVDRACQGLGRGLHKAGFEYLPDQNGEWRDGYYPITISNAYERRVSAAIGYLDPGTRQRPNLKISTDTQVAELLFEGKRCVGVVAHVRARARSSGRAR